jgi:hypothetical protein
MTRMQAWARPLTMGASRLRVVVPWRESPVLWLSGVAPHDALQGPQ